MYLIYIKQKITLTQEADGLKYAYGAPKKKNI